MYDRRTICRINFFANESRRKRCFFEICFIFALWFFSLFVFGSSVVGQDLVPQVVDSNLDSNISIPSFPIYIVPTIQGRYRSGGSSGYIVNNIQFINVKNDSSSSDWSDNKKKQFWQALAEYLSFGYCSLSDICDTYRYGEAVSTAYYPSDDIVIDIGKGALLSYFFDTSSNLARAFFFCGVNGVVYYRLTPLEDVYDVFVYLYLVPTKINAYGYNSQIGETTWFMVSKTSTPRDFVIGLDAATFTNNMHTYQIVSAFRVELTGSDHQLFQDEESYSLPFEIVGNTIGFAKNKNYYWTSYGTSEKGSTDYPIFHSYNFNASRLNTSNWSYYQELRFETVNMSYLLSGELFPNLESLDTDNGGMTDFHEWYQTKHVLTNPADDTDETEEIEPEKPELPEPEEGEEVVDIGKDTQDRYGAYWDEKTGDDEELPELTPPDFQDLPSPAPRDFYFDQVTSPIEQAFQTEMRDNKFKQKFDQTFDDFTANDAQFSWVINPSVNSTLVQMPLPSISIAPKTWIQDPVYGPYFRTFRACLLLVEFLFFMYKMYKLAVASLSGGPISADTGGEDDD